MLPDEDKTKEQLINELAEMRQRVVELEAAKTERRQAEEALRESERKVREAKESYDRIIDNADEVIFRVKAEGGHVIYVNPAAERLLGYSQAEWLADNTLGFKIIHPDFVEKQKQIIRQINTAKKPIKNTVLGWIAKDGREIIVEYTIIPVVDKKGEIIYFESIGRDITERKRMEEELKLEAQLLDTAADSVFLRDIQGKIVYVNKAAYESLGYSKDELMAMNFFSLVTPEQSIFIKSRRKELIERGETTFEIAHLRKDKSIMPIEVHARRIKSGDQKFTLSVIRDITERKQAEEALRESEAKYRGLVRNVKLGVFRSTLEPAGRFLEVNPAMVEITGYSRKELLQMNVSDLYVHPEEREAILGKVASATRKTTKEVCLRKKDGAEIIVSDTKVAVRDDAGRILYFDGIMEDITERKRAEEELRESEEFRSSLLNNSPYPILVINQDTSVRYANPALEKLTGFSSAELIGRKAPYPWWTEETLQKTSKDLEEAMSKGAPKLEEVFQKKNGERFWVEITSIPVRHNGEFKYYLANWVDITERKEAEEREKQLQEELSRSSRLASIGELAAGVAHEINNPLTGIMGFSERLLRKSADEKVSQDLESIRNEAIRAAGVIENLLTFARRREPEKEYSGINEIVQKALELRVYGLKTSNVEVAFDLAPSLPQIMVDFGQIQEVFLNIILNAEQAMTEAHGRGKLTVKTQQMKGYIRISFIDDGPGIPAEHLDKLFDPFFTTRAEKGGTGLGLSVCHGIVTKHGGKIYARSKVGKGATFFVELPLTTEEIDESKVVEEEPAVGIDTY